MRIHITINGSESENEMRFGILLKNDFFVLFPPMYNRVKLNNMGPKKHSALFCKKAGNFLRQWFPARKRCYCRIF